MMNETMKTIEKMNNHIKLTDIEIFEKYDSTSCRKCGDIAFFYVVFKIPFNEYYNKIPFCINCIKEYSQLDSYQMDCIGYVHTTLIY